MPLLRGGRPLKAWRYVGLFGPDVMLCAAEVRVGPVRQAFWAVHEPGAPLRERTRLGWRGGVAVGRRALEVADGRVRVELALEVEPGIECACPSGRQWAWTHKAPLSARGRVLGREAELRGILDASAGYHAREVTWRWCAGVGRTEDGRAAAWNLVTGINDPPRGSERAVWLDGELAEEPGPVAFAPGLAAVTSADGDELRFAASARRARRDRLGPFSSDYEQPFGVFSGTLPGGVALAEGWGVMERHEARW